VLRESLRFEWRYHARQASFIAAALLFFLLGFALTATGFGPKNLYINAPYLVTESFGFLSLFSVFAIAIFGSNAVVRDAEHRMEEIVYASPVGRFHYLFSRFAGVFLATFTCLSTSAIGMLLGSRMPWLDVERIAPIDVRSYLWALAVLTTPNVLFATTMLFAIAALTRSALATYVGAVFINILYFVGAALTNSPLMAASTPGAGGGMLPALLDPFGLSSFFEETRYWTMAEKNGRFLALEGTFLFNRMVWMGVSAAIWAGVYKTFSFRLLGRSKPKKTKAQRVAEGTEVAEPASQPSAYATVTPSAKTLRCWLASYASATRLELGVLLKSVPFVLLIVLWMLLEGTELRSDIFGGEYGSARYPATGLIITALRKPLALSGLILLIYYGAEVFWREHRFRMSAVLGATPVPGSVMIASKWTALTALVGCLITSGVTVGVALQMTKGYWQFEPLLYLSLFYFIGLPLALYAAAIVLIHALSPGKYVGMVAALLFVFFTQRAQMLGLDHHLWRFASAPPVKHTAMNGFGDHAAPFHGFMLYWSALGALFLLLAAGLWRSTGAHPKDRLRLLFGRSSPRGRRLALVLAFVIAASGGFIFYNTNILNAYTTTNALFDWKADYEKTYHPLAALPQPRISDIQAEVDLHPGERRYRVAGRYALVNDTQAAIETVLVAIRRDARTAEVSLPDARLATKDERFGMFRFELHSPLAPGARTELRFDLSFAHQGLEDGEHDDTIVDNGSFVMGFRSFPTIGYRKGYELRDPRERRKRGLSASAVVPLEEDAAHGADPEASEIAWVNFAATVSTSVDQIVVAPGHLERTWERDGRRYFQYRSQSPIRSFFAFASARYEVAKRHHRDTSVELYYHPEHRMNVERVLDAAVESLDCFEARFGPYPHPELKMAEVPSYWDFGGVAMPSTIYFVEDRVFLTDARDPRRLDLVTRRVAHEVAHQWWGHQLAPASIEGSTAIVESLTKYAELLVMERKHGREHVRQQLEMELVRYLSGRSREEHEEVPLYKVGDQAYLFYAKGALIMNAIRALIGDEAMNGALMSLKQEHGGPGGHATTLDLLEHLRRAAPREKFGLIEEWMKEIVLYDLKVAAASAKQRADGRYEVTIRVAAAKSKADGRGNESPVPLRESIQIGIFKVHPDDIEGPEAILYLNPHELHEGESELSIVVDAPPAFVAVDPYVLRIDKNRLDNIKALE